MMKKDIVIEQFGKLTVYDEQGNSVVLAHLWSEQAAILVFVRHFG